MSVNTAAILIGVGLGGFVDGIVLHQILQWHNMLSAVYPPHNMEAMKLNMTWDGYFHAFVWLLTLAGIYILFKAGKNGSTFPRTRQFTGMLLLGWGIFNLVEGIINHQLLSLHNVREIAGADIYNYTFLAIGGVGLILLGGLMARKKERY
jgi:uncharacterized membrane protein